MPIYEYRCTACDNELEKIQKFSDPPLTDCPECGRAALVKKVSAPSFRLKGTGWYETDFKTGKKSKVDDAGDRGESSGEGSGKKNPAETRPETAAQSGSNAGADGKSESSGKQQASTSDASRHTAG